MELKHEAPPSSRRVDYEYRDRVRSAAGGGWHELLQRIGVPGEILTGELSKCPECGGAFRFLDTRERGEFVCRQPKRPDVTGDGFALVGHLGGLSFGQAVRIVGEALGQREFPDKAARRLSAWGGVA